MALGSMVTMWAGQNTIFLITGWIAEMGNQSTIQSFAKQCNDTRKIAPIMYDEAMCTRIELEWALWPFFRALRNTFFNMMNVSALLSDVPSRLLYVLLACAGTVTGFKILSKFCGRMSAKKRKAERTVYVENAGRHYLSESTTGGGGVLHRHSSPPPPQPDTANDDGGSVD